jgi:beta-lactamase class D
MNWKHQHQTIFFIATCLLLASCGGSSSKHNMDGIEEPDTNEVVEETIEVKVPERTVVISFDSILRANKVTGSILIYDAVNADYYSNSFEWAEERRLPASTFKITNSIIGLETGVVEDENTLFKWDGKPRRLDIWEQDLTLQKAFHFSCVPCYQQVARSIGSNRMNTYLTKLDYGQMEVDSSNIDVFWLEGNSGISQFEQVDFLRRFHEEKLPLKPRTFEIMKRLMVLQETDSTVLRGKTGWSIRNGHNNGWFVGYLETNNGVFYFATNIDPQESFNMKLFPKIRMDITMEALDVLFRSM